MTLDMTHCMISMTLRRLSFVFLGFALIGSPSSKAYYGRSATEAILTFEASIEVDRRTPPNDVDLAIQEQISHLMGTFQSVSFLNAFKNPGVLGEDYTTKILGKEPSSETGRIRYRYKFKGKTVFQKNAFRSGVTVRKVPIKLPASPDRIYALGMVGNENRCTDEHYNSEGDFWYFWDPDMPGCPLKGNSTDVLRIEGKLEKLENTVLSYPEYDRLYSDNGNASTFEISVFLGYIDEEMRRGRPNRRDDAFYAMKEFETFLDRNAFSLSEKVDAFKLTNSGNTGKGANFYRLYEKDQKALGKNIKIRVKVLLSDTGISSKDPTFHAYLVPALEKSDIVVYDGHSGLGGNLHLEYLPPVIFSKSKYQVFFFNGCSSYPYFNGMFMKAKGRAGSLDIITAGLPTLSSTSSPNLEAFLEGFVSGKTLSYQKILSALDRSNGDEGTYLFGVSGDEDNRFKPSR